MEENNLLIFESSLKELFSKFANNPFYFFYEEDVRVELAQILKSKFKNIEIDHLKNKIITSPIKCEYPSSLANKQKHDIVQVKKNSLNNIYNLDLSVIIELKLGSINYDRCGVFKEDIKKLLSYNSQLDFGIALYFYQNNIDEKYFTNWFNDIVVNFNQIEFQQLTIEPKVVNTFIITPNTILKTFTYKEFY
ncbi:MAG: hypothetical protein IPH62_00870 [Ignavibacteriae bacterium]|nr:hypothetical protein [Ignavibacteriota bacterium]